MVEIASGIALRPETGDDLRNARRFARLTQSEIARAMDVDRTRVSALERQARPNRRAVRKYLAALAEAVRIADALDEVESTER